MIYFYDFSFILNTTVEPPHTEFVTAIIFRPENDTSAIPNQAPMLVTTDSVGYIKTWLLNFQIDSIRGNFSLLKLRYLISNTSSVPVRFNRNAIFV